MSSEVPLIGFHYDGQRATAIAGAIAAVLEQARTVDITAMDQLAGLGMAAADVLLASKLATRPEQVAPAFALFVQQQVAARRSPQVPSSPPG